MSKDKRGFARQPQTTVSGTGLAASADASRGLPNGTNGRKGLFGSLRSHLPAIGAVSIILFVGIGIMARNGWFPATDALSGKRTGWFGREVPKNSGSAWNPLAAMLPTPTPQLSKEYIYAGSRMLAVVDANAAETPPADLAVWRPSSGVWYVYNLVTAAWTSYGWGNSSDIPVQGDFDGDGKTDFAIYRPTDNNWWITTSGNSSYYSTAFGASGDIPVPADYDGDGRTDIAVFRPGTTNANWYVYQSSTSSTVQTQYGLSTDKPAPADLDGDGKADITVWRLSNTTFYTLRSSDTTTQSALMSFAGYTLTSGDKVVSADFDGDGRANYALRNGSSWLMLNSAFANMTVVTPSGDQASDIPVQNDFDGDGKVDIAVWRDSNGHWYIRKSGSSNALREEAWGISGDIPVPALWRR